MRRVQISGGLLACMLATFSHISQVLFLPSTIVRITGQDAWLAALLGGAGGTLIALVAAWVSVRHPRQSPAQIARTLLGKWIGGAVGLLYAGFFTWLYSLVLRAVLDFAVMALLPGTPGRVIVTLLGAVILYAVWDGLEPIARVSFQVLVAIILTHLALPTLLMREFRLLQVDPFLYHGVGSVLKATVEAVPWSGQCLVVMTLMPHLKQPRQGYRWVVIGMTGGALLLTHLVAQTVFVLGPNLPGRMLFPVYVLIQTISLLKILERLEVLLVTVWLSGMWLKGSLCLYAASEAAAHALGLKQQRWPAVVLAVAGVLLTQIWSSTLDVIYLHSLPGYKAAELGLEIALPVLLLAASFVRTLFRGQGRTFA